jgi:hypothetical protein
MATVRVRQRSSCSVVKLQLGNAQAMNRTSRTPPRAQLERFSESNTAAHQPRAELSIVRDDTSHAIRAGVIRRLV